METLQMEQELGAPPAVMPLEGLGASLGYAQVLFASDAGAPPRRARREPLSHGALDRTHPRLLL